MATKSLQHCSYTPKRHGSILLLVLVAIIIMTLTTTTYLLLMRNEHLAARYSGNHLQARMLAESGVDYLRVLLSSSDAELEQQGGLLDNAELMQDVLVSEDEVPTYQGRFTVLAPAMDMGEIQNVRYGLANESAKLNLNTLLDNSGNSNSSEESVTPRDRLLAIPGMDETVADSILDWLDEDDSPRANGAESAYYQNLSQPYLPRNGPIAQLEELLMVQGVTPELLYGVDANRNYMADSAEQPRGALERLDTSEGQLDLGWSAYLTANSAEKNATSAGEAKIDLNSTLLAELHGQLVQALGPAEANYIILYRQYSATAAAGAATNAATVLMDFSQEAQNNINSLVDLIDTQVQTSGATPKTVASPWTSTPASLNGNFATLQDACTVDAAESFVGKININLASRPVLLTIPNMTESLADQILGQRDLESGQLDGDQRHPTWLVAEGLLALEELKPLLPFITTRGDIYRGQIVGFFDGGMARSRLEVLLDRSGSQTRLIGWQDLSSLGPGFSRTILSTLVERDE